MDFDRVIKERHSTRSFKNKKVPWGDMVEAVNSALQGPFAGNINNLRFVISENKEKIQRIANFSEQVWIDSAPAIIAVCSEDSHLEGLYDERAYFYSEHNAAAAINTILLKLTDLKIQSCWVGSFDESAVKSILEIPFNIRLQGIVVLGYEDQRFLKPRKRSVESKIFWESWDSKTHKS